MTEAFPAARLNGINHETMHATAEFLRFNGCEVLVPGALYRIDDAIFTYRELVAHVAGAIALDPTGRPLSSTAFIDQGIVAFQRIAGVTPVTKGLRMMLCREADIDSAKAMEMAREIASWAWLTAPPVSAMQKEMAIEESAHCLLHWVANVKRRILGLPVNGQQIMLYFYGIGGTLKSSIVKAILAPLGPLQGKFGNPDNVLHGHDGALVSTKVALFWDECVGMAPRHLDSMKDLVTAEEMRANPKGKDAVDVRVLASLVATSNYPPVVKFPDPAMLRRMGSICFSFPVPEEDQARYMQEKVLPFDMLAFWKAVDPEASGAEKHILARNQRRHRYKSPVEQFLTEYVTRKPGSRVLLKELHQTFITVATANNWKEHKDMSNQGLAAMLRMVGYDVKHSAKGAIIAGIELLDEPTFPQETGDETVAG